MFATPIWLHALEKERHERARLFQDPVRLELAGNHGNVATERFCLEALRFQAVRAVRARHLNNLASRFHFGNPCQIVNIGAGLDERGTLKTLPQGSIVFDLDTPVMLRQRREMLSSLPLTSEIRRIEVPIDLCEHDIADTLKYTPGFVVLAPTLVTWEGGSMYYEIGDNMSVLNSLSELLHNPHSRFWMDYVHSSVVDGTSDLPEVQQFTESMSKLGLPFVTGFADVAHELGKCGLVVDESTPSSYYLNTTDPVFDVYSFCVARGARP